MFENGRIEYINMGYLLFHKHNICETNDYNHFENMNYYGVSNSNCKEFIGEIVEIMWKNCVKNKFVNMDTFNEIPNRVIFC
jgi:hypothetical protein